MERIYSEEDITWSSVEKYVPYARVNWHINENGIPTYEFFDEFYNKIDVKTIIEEVL